MSNLVIMKDRQAVTSSLNVAENFEKQHKHVIEAIEKLLQEDGSNFRPMFVEGNEPDSYDRPRKVYYMNRDGFSFLVMGFTGVKAREFKLKYIQAFNAMESRVKDASLMSPEDIMIATLEAQKEFKTNLRLVQEDVADLKQEINLSRSQKHRLSGLVRKNVYDALGGRKAAAYADRSLRARTYSHHWREIKNYFDVEAYEEIPKIKFDEAIEFTKMWQPSTELKMLINGKNNEIPLEV